MTETVEAASNLNGTITSEAGATKSNLKATNAARQRRSSTRKVVISDNPMNQTGKSSTMRGMNQTAANAENLQKSTKEGGPQSTMGGSGTAKSLLGTKKRTSKPAYLQSLNESEKQANFKIIDSMNKKISYLKNPRHKVSKAPILMTTVSLNIQRRKLIATILS